MIEIVWSAKVFTQDDETGVRIEETPTLGFSVRSAGPGPLRQDAERQLKGVAKQLAANLREYFLPPVPVYKDNFDRASRLWAEDELDLEPGSVVKVTFEGECEGCYSCDYTPGSYQMKPVAELRDGTRRAVLPGSDEWDLSEILRKVMEHG